MLKKCIKFGIKIKHIFPRKKGPKNLPFWRVFGTLFAGKSGHFCHFLFKWAPDLQKVPREVSKGPQIGGFCSQFGTQNSNLWSFWDFPRHFLELWRLQMAEKSSQEGWFLLFLWKNTHVFIFLVPCLKYFLLVFLMISLNTPLPWLHYHDSMVYNTGI